MLYVNHRERKTQVLGPGLRYVIWVQGCKKNCPGCINPQGRRLNENGYWLDSHTILQEIQEDASLMGITISGGEPFLQSESLAELIKLIRKNTKLDIMMYSGYTLQELHSWENEAVEYILDNIDILVDGEYMEELNTNSIYRGSDNQTIHLLSKKYLHFKKAMENTKNRDIEFVYRDDELFMVGIPEKGFDEKLKDILIKYADHSGK